MGCGLLLQGCSNLYRELGNRQQMKCFKQPSPSDCCLLHSPSVFPCCQCCISLSFTAAVLHFPLFCPPLSTFSVLLLFTPWVFNSCPSPSLRVKPSFFALAINFLFLVMSHLYFLPSSTTGCFWIHLPSRLLFNIGSGDPRAALRHCCRSWGARHSQLQGDFLKI